MKQYPLWQFIQTNIGQQLPVMLLYVLESKGSSPGRQGFAMAVNATGEMIGSIGGGIMEHKLIEMAKERLQQEQHSIDLKKQIHNKSASRNQSGMICSGEQTILLYMVREKDNAAIQQLLLAMNANTNGALKLSPAGIEFSTVIPTDQYNFIMRSENDWQYEEQTGYKNNLYIIGGGHCSLALCKIMKEMDFYICIYEDRSSLPTLEQNLYAHEKITVDDYSLLKNIIPDGENHYVVIMTVGYRTDDIAVRSMLYKNFAYLGLLGSKAKISKMMDDYRAEGIDNTTLEKIHAPIGIPINSQTPEEIAVSIVAEIIKRKNS